MRLIPDDLAYLSECAIAAAKQAGQLIESYANKAVSVQHKHGGDNLAAQVVTEVDILSEAAIIKTLQPACERYDLALLTEERTDDKTRLHKDYFWCIDPLDGTLPFIESTPGYAVSIALVAQSGAPLIGVIYDPVTHTLSSAVHEQGVFRNGKPWAIASAAPMEERPLTLVCDRGLLQQPYYPDLYQALESIAKKQGLSGLRTLHKGGAVMNACWVLDNPPACYFKCPKPEAGGGSLWDFAATTVIFNELRSIASDFYGQTLDLNRKDSTFMNHRGVIFATDQALATDIKSLLELCAKE
jgi:3'(2'), 5'-bisphosphate nucleotidase/myo-inositol-1(or 4)-monophosphatase